MKTNSIVIAWLILMNIVVSSCKNSEKKESEPSRFMGYIESTQVNVTGRIAGQITKILVDEGDTVKEGQIIARLDDKELNATMAAMNSQLKNVSLNKGRMEHLYQTGAVAQQKLDEIATAHDVLSNNILALSSRIEDMEIKAPVNGVVNVRLLEKGQMLNPGMPIMVITDPQGTWARFSIPENYINQISLGKHFILKSNIAGVMYEAKVVQMLPMADFATRTPTTLREERDVRVFDIKLQLKDNPRYASVNSAKPGMYVYLALQKESQGSTKN